MKKMALDLNSSLCLSEQVHPREFLSMNCFFLYNRFWLDLCVNIFFLKEIAGSDNVTETAFRYLGGAICKIKCEIVVFPFYSFAIFSLPEILRHLDMCLVIITYASSNIIRRFVERALCVWRRRSTFFFGCCNLNNKSSKSW